MYNRLYSNLLASHKSNHSFVPQGYVDSYPGSRGGR